MAYLGSGDAGELRELVGRVAGAGTLLPGQAVRVISLGEFYGAAGPVDPAAVISRYDAATQGGWLTGAGGCGSALM